MVKEKGYTCSDNEIDVPYTLCNVLFMQKVELKFERNMAANQRQMVPTMSSDGEIHLTHGCRG